MRKIKIRCDLDYEPYAYVHAGETGRLESVDDYATWVRLDKRHPDLEDNLIWFPHDIAPGYALACTEVRGWEPYATLCCFLLLLLLVALSIDTFHGSVFFGSGANDTITVHAE